MINPLLAKVKLPGRIFQLPSKGIFYSPGVLAPSVKDAEVHVHPMSALAEIKLRSADLLFSGRALKEVCSECIPDILKPELLVAKDVDAVFTFLRIVTYGSMMTIKSRHDCEKAEVNEYQVDIEKIAAEPNNTSLKSVDLLYHVKLSTDQVVRLRPVRFQDTMDIAHLRQLINSKLSDSGQPDDDLVQTMVIRDLMSVIDAVETEGDDNKILVITDINHIEQWARSLTKRDFNAIVDQSERAGQWGFNLTAKLHCKQCNEQYDHPLELDPVNFFSG